MIFETFAVLVLAGLFGLTVNTQELDVNTLLQFLTVVLIIWHNRRVRTKIEPKVEQVAALARRQLGERNKPTVNHRKEPWNGVERRKDHS